MLRLKTSLLPLLFMIMLPWLAFGKETTDTLPNGYGQRFSKQQIEADIAFMIRSMESAHPNLYHSITKEQYGRLKDSVAALLKDSMTRDEAWPLFAKMIAVIDEGHMVFDKTPEIRQDVIILKKPLFPIFMQSFDGKAMVVKKDYSANPVLKPGDRVTKINGHKVDSLVQMLSAYYGGLPHWRHYKVVNSLIWDLYRFHIRAPFQIEYSSAGQKKQYTYAGTTAAEINKAIGSESKAVKAPFTFERLKNNIGYINFSDMDYSYGDQFDTFLLKTFTEIHQKQVKALIIDLRENGGGDSKLGYNLLQFITNKPFRMSGGVRWKISQEYKDYIGQMDSTRRAGMTYYTNMQNGEFLTGGDDAPKKPKDNALRYKGKVCFLIGNQTFSSANMLAATVMDYKLATLIGEVSGEMPNDYGDIFTIKLPQTGMTFQAPSKQIVRPNGDKDNMDPILPDIYVKQNAVTKEDEVLQRAIQWVMKGK